MYIIANGRYKKNNFFGNKFIHLLSDYQMSDNPVIDDAADKIEIDIDKIDEIDDDKIDDKIDVDKIFTFDNINDEPHKLHNGKPITMIEISPNEKYLITYSKEDGSIIGWNVEDIDKVQLKFDQTVKINEDNIKCLCVSDDKKLAYNKGTGK
jgi:WD40 repeat protein